MTSHPIIAPPVKAAAMNARIYRYRLDVADAPKLDLPAGARVLSVAPPRDLSLRLDLWALVDPDAPAEPREFRIVADGLPVPDRLGRFIATVPMAGGSLIWHVFEAAP